MCIESILNMCVVFEVFEICGAYNALYAFVAIYFYATFSVFGVCDIFDV